MNKSRMFFVIGVFLLAGASCTAEVARQAEAKAAQAEKNANAARADLATCNESIDSIKTTIDRLEARVKEAEERAKKAEGAIAPAKVEKIMNVGAKPAAPETKAAKGPKELPDAVRVHSLANKEDIALESKQLAPALKACDSDGKLGLAVCVKPKQTAYSAWYPVLVTWNTEAVTTIADARKVLGCLQKHPAVGHDNDSGKNDAELVVLATFTGGCQ
jgi:septal ring factor EnvC (AmiA/AmiB activator)